MRIWFNCISTTGLFVTILLFLFSFPASAEEVGKYAYKGFPEYLDGRTIQTPDDIVALSETVRAFDSSSSFSSGGAVSLMLVIDNSTSMFLKLPDNQPPGPFDAGGARYSVANKVVDELYAKSPDSKIGISIFSSHLYFDKNDDVLVKELDVYKKYPSIVGGIIPLLKLNETNTVGKYAGMSGYQVLKEYLKTKDTSVVYKGFTNNYTNLQYEPSNGNCDPLVVQPSGTNVWAGFAGAKEAMLDCGMIPENQYIIFFSDGDQGHVPAGAGPGFGENWDEIAADKAPTTFCVYVKTSSITFPLENFIDFIKVNNYSANNPKSSFQQITTGQTAIMSYIMNSVLTQIITNSILVTPKSCSVNGTTCPNSWANDAFVFNDLFPLQNPSTDFNYKITYGRKEIIISGSDTTIQTKPDTTVDIDYTVHVTNGEDLGDSLELTFWGRNLDLFYNGTEIGETDIITDDMKNLEIRFESYRVDTLYSYQDMIIEVTHVQGTDKEIFTLEDKGSYWAYTFPRVIGSANAGDNTLQHDNPDSIVCTFRNPDLPLDTLRIARCFYEEHNGIKVTKGIYFDNTADGKVDSIFLAVTGNDFGSYVDAIMSNIDLPVHRSFAIGNYSAVSGGIAVPVTENASATLTYVTNDDVMTIDSVELVTDVVLLSSTITFIDSIAPVIMTADLVDTADLNARDELTVVFSEDVETITESRPFKFYQTAGGTVYDATLSVLSQSGAQAVFEVISISGASEIVQGDSIRINATISDKIRDGLGNRQDHPGNIRREIEVIIVEEGLKVTKAIYFDNTADGHVDSIFIQVYGEIQNYIDELMKAITLPPHRDFLVQGSAYSNGGIAVDVTERSSTVRTYVTEEDSIKVKKKVVLPDSMIILTAGVAVIDSMAPIIMNATMVDSIIVISIGQIDSLTDLGRDELTVVFSENIEALTYNDPFKFFCTTQQQPYDAILALVSQNANQGVFTVESLNGVSRIIDGDSIRINWNYGNNVYDALPNNQDNPKNIRRPINLETILDTIYVQAEYDLILKSTILELNKEGIMVITVEPDSFENVSDNDRFEAMLNIFDAVGNEIIRDRPMEYDAARKRLIYFWDGRNENQKRIVGAGAYKAIVPVDIYFVDEKQTVVKQAMVGVKD